MNVNITETGNNNGIINNGNRIVKRGKITRERENRGTVEEHITLLDFAVFINLSIAEQCLHTVTLPFLTYSSYIIFHNIITRVKEKVKY